jgi:REP element-mobilizing transposase RayT
MPRAHRHYLPGHVWHITHRCHKKEFLLKFAKDRDCWLDWLLEAKQRYETCIFNYMVTSNHVHLLLLDNGGRDVIPRTLQLIAGRTGQEYNQRKSRQGAFWEDRYHATAVQSDEHLMRCLIYIDLNMVRAGAVAHPSEWPWSGYNEIQTPKQRYALINRTKLMALLGIYDDTALSEHHRQWISDALEKDSRQRESRWTESVAVGSKTFIEQTKEQLGFRTKGRKIEENDEVYTLRETGRGYDCAGKNSTLSPENGYFWDDMYLISSS